MDTSPRNAREALIAELLGDVDNLLTRQEANIAKQTAVEETLARSTTALIDAGKRYRQLIDDFNENAKKDLSQYVREHAARTTANTVDEQRAAIQEVIRAAFSAEATRTKTQMQQTAGGRIVEHAITAFIASGATAGLVYAIFSAC